MRIIILLLLLISGFNLRSQELTKATRTQSTLSFSHVGDSIIKLINPQNSVIIKTPENYREFYITKVDNNYSGYLIKNLENDMLPKIESTQPMLTEIFTFDADVIYQNLLKKNLNYIIQLTEDEIQKKNDKAKQKSKKHYLSYSLPKASHDAMVTIIINGPQSKSATYRWVLIDAEDLHHVSALKIFYDVQQYLAVTFKEAYK
ncbi:hypothetical protein [Flavobacterium subsaxonicum]|uniref:Uncharacterized protein n=1 Tax=Flavobacterium subsaxonicum WB 4.1-42 = DSM 21790 TaxID=1121898 RepID=A0A0A2MJY1_9FLAO|nr:hypothetical protein [Flavobacterium subsaxonicum]KGO92952.1 hypothetical protein Q766_10000 [Flavobacterium subsaxonicum WB 4.1-42 = DSM 21790]